MGKAIRAAMHSAGYDGVPGALTPSTVTTGGLFGPSTGPLLSPQHAAEFATANGKLIHTLPVRHDLQMDIRLTLSVLDGITVSWWLILVQRLIRCP